MAFLNPLFFLGALTLAVPILVHLVRKDKSDIVKFSSLMFLLRIPKKTVRQHMLRNLLLMAMRLVLLALLIMAFARPYLVDSTAAPVTGENSRGIVMLLDNSYSMTYGTNFQRMQAEAVDRIQALEPGDSASLIAFSDRATVLGVTTSDQVELIARVNALEPTANSTAYYEAFAMADRALAQFEGLNRDLVVISDFQRNGWNRSSREAVIDSDVRTELVDLGVENPENVGFESVNVDATVFTRTYEGQMLGRINNYNLTTPATVTVSVDVNGRTVESKEVTIPAESSELVEFTGFELPIGYSQGRVRIEDDDELAADNEFIFSTLRRDRLRLLVIDQGRPDQSRFLRDAFASAPELPFAVEIKRVDDVSVAELDNFEVVIVNDVERFSDAVRAKLQARRSQGQGQLVFLGNNADLDWWRGFDSLPVTIGERIFVERDRNRPYYSLTTYERSHAVFSALEQGTRLRLNTAQFFAFVDVSAKDDAVEIARFEDGSAAIVESAAGAGGSMIVLNSTVESTWNDLPVRPTFPPLIYETVRYLARYRDSRAAYQLGEAVTIPATEVAVAVITPDGERVNIGDEAAAGARFFTPDQRGFYEVRIGPDTAIVAVNASMAESQLERILPDDLRASVQRLEGEVRRGALLAEAQNDNTAERQNWWWWILVVALALGAAEVYLANRVTRENRAPAPIRGVAG